jgi:surface antigen
MSSSSSSSTRRLSGLLLGSLLVIATALGAVSALAPGAAASTITYQNGGANYSVPLSTDPFGDDYPAALRTATQDSIIDPWRFYNRECTSFVAWRLNVQLGATSYPGGPWKFSNFMTAQGVPGTGGVQFGNAGTWDAAATKLGYRVDTIPAVGAVAQWRGGESSYNWSGSALGHVGIVVAVAGDGTITMASYNAGSPRGTYNLIANIKAPRYLHIADLNGDPRIPPFVDAAYTDFLNRPPTAAEMSLVSAALQQRSASYASVALMLANSNEWVTDLVDAFYQSMLGRPPDPAGGQYWVNRIINGLPVPDAAAMLYGSAEYYSLAGGTPTSWVASLYQAILGRTADSAGLQYWVGQIAAVGQVGVALQLYQSLESRQTRVQALYKHLLGRGADSGGLAFWSGRILTSGDLALASYLASSDEYLDRAESRFPKPFTRG